MKDRIATYPGRVRLVPVAGQSDVYDMAMADEPSEIGTALNKANLLTDETAAAIAVIAGTAPTTPNEAFAKLLAFAENGNVNNLTVQLIKKSMTWTAPKAINQKFYVIAGGGGGGGGTGVKSDSDYFGGGGGGGCGLDSGSFEIQENTSVTVVVGAAGATDADGGTTSFGDYLTAEGGKKGSPGNTPYGYGGDGGNAGAGGGGGGGGGYSSLNASGDGGNGGTYGGGGGGGGNDRDLGSDGGNGGTYGGGGGANETSAGTPGTGGTYGGDANQDGTFGEIFALESLFDIAKLSTRMDASKGARGVKSGGGGYGGRGGDGASYTGGGGGGGYFGNGGTSGVGILVGSHVVGAGGGGGFCCDGGSTSESPQHAGGGGGGGFFCDGGVASSNYYGGQGGGFFDYDGGVLILYQRESGAM